MKGMFLFFQITTGSNPCRYMSLLTLSSHATSIILLYCNDRLLIISILNFKLHIHNEALNYEGWYLSVLNMQIFHQEAKKELLGNQNFWKLAEPDLKMLITGLYMFTKSRKRTEMEIALIWLSFKYIYSLPSRKEALNECNVMSFHFFAIWV